MDIAYKMNRLHDVYVAVAIIVVAVLVVLYTQTATDTKSESRDLDRELVRIRLSEQNFDIPLRYLYGQAIEKYHQWPRPKKKRVPVKALSLSVLLPDLRPYHKEDDARWVVRGHGDRLEVSIMKPVGGEGWYKFVRGFTNQEVASGVSAKEPDVYGLASYMTPLGPKYFPLDDSRVLSISCVGANRKNDAVSHSCKVKSYYRPGIVLEYYYGLKYLPHWSEIDDGLKTMFDRLSAD